MPMFVSRWLCEISANGEFTNVHKASWDGENEIVMVAVKHLAADASHLLEVCHQLHKLCWPTIS